MLSNAFRRLCRVKRGKRILFLLGAGASIPAKYPKTEEISKHLFSGMDVVYHTKGLFYINGKRSYDSADQNKVDLAREIYRLFAGTNHLNYEEVFNRIYGFYLECDKESPVYSDSLRIIKSKIIELINKHKHNINGFIEEDSEVLSTLSRTLEYISDITREKIFAAKGKCCIENMKHLSLFFNLLNDGYCLDIFTLNHDTLLEDYFSYHDLEFIDGFEKVSNSYGRWNSAQFNVAGQTRIFKLHGSVDWFRVSYPGEKKLANTPWGSGQAVTSPMNTFLAKIKDPTRAIEWGWKEKINGQDVRIENKSGVFLVGTQNKYYSYAVDPFLTLLCTFSQSLKYQDRIIIIGYGFGDSAINRNIDEWQSKAPTSRQVCYIGYSKGNEEKSCEEMSQSDIMIEAKLGRVQVSKCSFAGIQSEHASETIQAFISN